MKSLRAFLFAIIAFTFYCPYQSAAQALNISCVPEIGKKIDDIRFEDVNYFDRKSLSLSEFKGKLVILDFFTTGCSACFESMPKVNKLYAEYKDKIQVIMVGLDEKNLRSVYEKYRIKKDLKLPVVFVNREKWSQFEILGVPHILIIDTGGTVRAITHAFDKNDIIWLLAGKDPGLIRKISPLEDSLMHTKYTIQVPLLINGNGGSDSIIMFRSLLTKWSGSIYSLSNPVCMYDMNARPDIKGDTSFSRFEVIGYDLKRLYRIAYGDTLPEVYGPFPNSYGNFWPQPVLDVQDSSAFIFKSNSTKNMYNYSLIVPRRDNRLQYMQQIMQRDLSMHFGFNGIVEERMMPCWKLVATETARKKLQATGRKFAKVATDRTDISLVDKPISMLIEQLYFCFPAGNPIMDATGISTNIDIYIEGYKNDFEDIRKGLQKNGLDLIQSEKKMRVVVIRDRANN